MDRRRQGSGERAGTGRETRRSLLPWPRGWPKGPTDLVRSPYRRARVEALEPRWLLAAPGLAPIPDVTLLSGAPLHVALDGDAGGEAIAYEVVSSNPALSAEVLGGNQSLRISVERFGDMVFALFEDLAPRTTGRIEQLAAEGFYDGLTFHRVASLQNGDPFVIQGGDPEGTGTGGSGTMFDDEFHPLLMHTSRGILSMAKSLDDTNDSQFFVTASDTRFLDFQHSVFGFLVEGEDVRRAIQSVAVDENDRPIEPVVMSSVSVFPDQENAVLRLAAAEGTSGEADVTVTARNARGEKTVQTFRVTIQPDTENGFPFLEALEPIRTEMDTPAVLEMAATDVEGDPVFFGGWNLARWPAFGADWQTERNPHLTVEVDPETGRATVTPRNGLVGVHGVLLGVNGFSEVDEDQTDPRTLSGFWDFQFVPVFIAPPAPVLQLPASSDTGQRGDGLVSVPALPRNADGQPEWKLIAHGIVEGAQVSIRVDGAEVPQSELGRALQADGTYRVTVRLDRPGDLAEGPRQITAVQTLPDQPVHVGNRTDRVDLASRPSDPLAITVDNTPPTFLSTPALQASAGRLYQYDADTPEEAEGDVQYRLIQSPAGMLLDTASGQITWTPRAAQAGKHAIEIRATDAAGNFSDQAFDIEVAEAPVLDPIGPQEVTEGQTVTFTATATGGLGRLRFSLDAVAPDGSPLPARASIDPDTGQFRWDTGEADGRPEVHRVAVRVTDSLGSTSIQVVPITVHEQNRPPVITSVGGRPVGPDPIVFQADEHRPLEWAVTARDPDLPPNRLTFELGPDSPEGAAIDPETGRFTWTPGEAHGGQAFDLLIRVWDEGFTPDEATVGVVVREVDEGAVSAAADAQMRADLGASPLPRGRSGGPIALAGRPAMEPVAGQLEKPSGPNPPPRVLVQPTEPATIALRVRADKSLFGSQIGAGIESTWSTSPVVVEGEPESPLGRRRPREPDEGRTEPPPVPPEEGGELPETQPQATTAKTEAVDAVIRAYTGTEPAAAVHPPRPAPSAPGFRPQPAGKASQPASQPKGGAVRQQPSAGPRETASGVGATGGNRV